MHLKRRHNRGREKTKTFGKSKRLPLTFDVGHDLAGDFQNQRNLREQNGVFFHV
jgi:hypothetical protein